jgi:EmrB/QacA subfamily drug resistance transporter
MNPTDTDQAPSREVVPEATSAAVPPDRARWSALYVLCLGSLMIVLDSSIVNVALPSVRSDLGFSAATLAWVVNAYTLTFGGFLLLAGRLGDLYGNRRVFLAGVAGFTSASLLCGLAGSATWLVIGRGVQGLAGAVVSAIALSLTMSLFTTPADRAKAMGVFGFVMSSGGAIGVLLGGVLTGLLSWHWIFLVNLPVGIAVVALSLRLLPAGGERTGGRRLDVAGAVTVTGALVLATSGVLGTAESGWTSARTLVQLGAAAVLLAVFAAIELRVREPLVRFGLLRSRNLVVANVCGVLWAGSMFAWFFFAALYLQQVLGYGALEVGLAFVPACVIMGVLSLKVSDRLVLRFGIRLTFVVGLALAASSLLLFARAPLGGHYATDVLPSMLLLGVGGGIAFNPLLLAAMGDVGPEDAGLASGVMNTAFMMGGALGLGVLASLAAGRTSGLLAAGSAQLAALRGGYSLAFGCGGVAALAAAALVGSLLRRRPPPAA